MQIRTMAFAACALLLAPAACGTSDVAQFEDDNADASAKTGNTGNTGASGGTDGSIGGGRGDGGRGSDCSPNLTGIVRDFRAWNDGQGHPDFERYGGAVGQKRMVTDTLGEDFKPVYNPDPEPDPPDVSSRAPGDGPHAFLTSKESFDQWYRDVPGVNIPFEHQLLLTNNDDGTQTFADNSFFPIDGKGFGDEGQRDTEDQLRNFGFTFELHTEFKYTGGEVFQFTGDDDLWTFINGKLAIDLGGLHSALTANVALDEIADDFGLVLGETYPLDVFHAERHTNASNFRIDTSIEFTNCEPIVH